MSAPLFSMIVNAFPNGVDNTQRQQVIYGICSLPTAYTTNGLALNWNALFNAEGGSFQPDIAPGTTVPIVAYFTSSKGGVVATSPATGVQSYIYDAVHGSLRVYGGSTEVANAGTLTADTITFEAHFGRGV